MCKIYIQIVKLFHICSVSTKNNTSIHHMQKQKIETLSAFSVQSKVQCLTWNHQMLSRKTARRNFRNLYQKTPPACINILSWVENFKNLGHVENSNNIEDVEKY